MGDTGGGVYSDDFIYLTLTKENAETVVVNSKTKVIQSTQSVNAFQKCKNTLTTLSFGPNPSLETIQDYSFFQCKFLNNVDLSVCTKLITIGISVFSGCSSLTSIKLPNSVTTLGDSIFHSTNIENFDLPASVTVLPYQCFTYCKNLKSVNIPQDSNLTELKKWIIRRSSLKTFRIPAKVHTLIDAVFEDSSIETIIVSSENPNYKIDNNLLIDKRNMYIYCCPAKSTGNIVIPNGVKGTYGSSFRFCTIDSVEFPSTLWAIFPYSFAGSTLKSVYIPDTISYIGDYAFENCGKLNSIRLPSNINSISSYCFYGTNISHIDIPSNIKTLNTGCFLNCPNLRDVELPDGIEKLDGKIFDDGTNIHFSPNSRFYIDSQYLILDKENTTVTQYLGSNTNVNINIPPTITTIGSDAFKGKNLISSFVFTYDSALTQINSGAFSDCRSATFVNLPNTISSIGEKSFLNCNQLQSLVFTSSLKTLSSSSFSGCKFLREVHIEDSKITSLPDSCFMNCNSLSSIIIPNTVTEINSLCFYLCTSLSKVEFGTSVKSIGQSSFQQCNLAKVDMHMCKSLINISDYAFYNNTNLDIVVLPDNIERFGAYSFSRTSLTNMTIPTHLVNLGPYSFSECHQLESLTIPSDSSLTTSGIGIGSFKNCFRISSISCESERFSIFSGALFNKQQTSLILFPPASSISFFSLPPTTQIISEGAFMSCFNLVSIFIPSNSLSLISNNAFEGCSSLSWINIPICVSDIGEDAFIGCTSLRCGLEIENKNREFLKNIVDVSKLDPQCLHDCASVFTCKENIHHVDIGLIQPFIVMLV
ncbi:surface antigen BspA-like [Trichomonas vaginalis G3]|uniref:Surface antigen BspA-like n=1 Tax=Trichomonas vaginalis (strain ATCC PRA-98 / G3) TaxID=412133 RepID=A2FQM4_TRIV3|nr:antigen BSP-related family [Trichomonas vaginalis G3]EAX92799.1 surface antigen BspA-like [Trichomonas vaginalis G3]KAI5483727.1 antigen BSP-related family [Trichomonas vaginalis G3]|eukprot:XP_001305729.1 surface antigen BspA-like [Trichomonas vaginalis G3]